MKIIYNKQQLDDYKIVYPWFLKLLFQAFLKTQPRKSTFSFSFLKAQIFLNRRQK